MYKNILIPTDGSKLSSRAIKAGIALAKSVGAKVTGLFVAPSPTPLVYKGIIPVGYMTTDEHAAVIKRTAERHLGVIQKIAKAQDVPCDCITLTGDFPAESILQVASKHKCDLIFMSSHGLKGVTAFVLGSETQKVLTHAKIPVLVHR